MNADHGCLVCRFIHTHTEHQVIIFGAVESIVWTTFQGASSSVQIVNFDRGCSYIYDVISYKLPVDVFCHSNRT